MRMRNRTGELLRYVLIIFLLQAAAGCRNKETMTPETKPMLMAMAIPGNLIVNSSFTDWDSHAGVLKNWNTTSTERGVIVKSGNGLKISGNDEGSYYIYQR